MRSAPFDEYDVAAEKQLTDELVERLTRLVISSFKGDDVSVETFPVLAVKGSQSFSLTPVRLCTAASLNSC